MQKHNKKQRLFRQHPKKPPGIFCQFAISHIGDVYFCQCGNPAMRSLAEDHTVYSPKQSLLPSLHSEEQILANKRVVKTEPLGCKVKIMYTANNPCFSRYQDSEKIGWEITSCFEKVLDLFTKGELLFVVFCEGLYPSLI